MNNLCPTCGSRVKQQFVCPTCDVVVPRDQTKKGYEFAKGQYVTFTDEELKAVQETATGDIDITEFVPLADVDPIFYDKAYYLSPERGGARAYHLFAEAMRQTGLSAVAHYAARGKQYLVMLRPVKEGIVLQQLLHDWEMRPISDVPIDPVDVKDAELSMAVKLIKQSAKKTFRPARYKDEVRARIEELIERKIEGEDITEAPKESPKAQVIDLMDALKASLAVADPPAVEEDDLEGDRKGPKRATDPATTKDGKSQSEG